MMRTTVTSCVMVLGLSFGCRHTYVRPELPQAKPAKMATGEVLPVSECQVLMEVYNITKNGTKTIETTPLCIKFENQPFRIPFPIYLTGAEGSTQNQFGGLCLDDSNKETSTKDTCSWTGLYRDDHPFTFKIHTKENAVALSEYARTIRVFRNGKLVYSWKNDNSLAEVLIPGSSLRSWLMPYGAPIDLRIIPTTAPDDPRVVTVVDQSIDPLKARIAAAKTVVVGLVESSVQPRLQCLQWLIAKAEATARGIMDQSVKPPEPLAGCQAPEDGDVAKLHERVRQAIRDGATTADRAIDAEIARLGIAYGDRIRDEAQKAKDALIQQGANTVLSNGRTVASTITQIDEMATAGAQVFDYVERSLRTTLADVKRFAKDRDAQVRQFAIATEALELQGSVFEPYTKNPELVEGETALDMRYGDKFQGFLLAPWHGVPFRVTRNPGADLDLATAIPILDLGGFRYQWGTGRAASFRAGLGIMYFKDEDQQRLALGSTMTTSVFNVAAEANISWTGIVLGFGYVLNTDRSYASLPDVDRIRLIVGADLFKVFGNRNAEAF